MSYVAWMNASPPRFLKAVMTFFVLTLLITAGSGCKPRRNQSEVAGNGGLAYAQGPNMSACAGNPDSCNCVLNNEFDFDKVDGKFVFREGHPPKVGDARRKSWFEQCIGQEVWYKATGGSGRFHVYYQEQKVNAFPDWGAIFHAESHNARFSTWGFVNDPSCCIPGDDKCKNVQYKGHPITLDDTFGFEFCPGDEKLLSYVGSGEDYTNEDPACGLERFAAIDPTDPGNPAKNITPSNKACHLAFGTSAGVVGMRKFPNPRFNAKRWADLNNKSLSSWENFSRRVPGGGGKVNFEDARASLRLDDGSVEPPYLIGEACGTCHVGFNPVKPPENPANPKWENVLFAIGNIYINFQEVMAAGTKKNTLEHQVFFHSRAGTVDTSAFTNDYVNNPGTFNAIINLDRRPGIFASVDPDSGQEVDGPFMEKQGQSDIAKELRFPEVKKFNSKGELQIPHVLKGGEDSVGPAGAVRRVYLNIFSCTETCLANHLDDLKVFSGHGARQTPFDGEQCSRDCPSYGAVKDRTTDIYNFLLHVRPTDLREATEGKAELAKVAGDFEDGMKIFADNCAKCHSSNPGQNNPKVGKFVGQGKNIQEPDIGTFMEVMKQDLAADRPLDQPRLDWLGNDNRMPAKFIETNYCRALHSNHMEGHLWEHYGSESYRNPDYTEYASLGEEPFDFRAEHMGKADLGGRGFYRNISLLNVWAHAPFMHNNAVGVDFYNGIEDFKMDYKDGQWVTPNPSVKGRLEVFERSMEMLLNPSDTQKTTRLGKREVTTRPITVVLGPKLSLPQGAATALQTLEGIASAGIPAGIKDKAGKELKKLENYSLSFPAGVPISVIGGLRHKKILDDMTHAAGGRNYVEIFQSASDWLKRLTSGSPQQITEKLIYSGYVNCTDLDEDHGHPFLLAGPENAEKRRKLINFMKSL